MRMLIAILIAGGLSLAVAQEPPHSSMHSVPVQIDAQIITDNEFVQVVRMSIPPHAATPIHDVTPRVVVWLRDAHFVDRFVDGSAREERRTAGDVEWVPQRRHSGQNLSDEPMEFVAVIVKAAAADARHVPPAGPHR